MYRYQLLDTGNIDQILFLQKDVVAQLEDSNFFRASTKEMLSRFLQSGCALGAFVENKLIAYRLIYLPKDNEDNLGLDLDLVAHNLHDVLHFETTVVHPKFRKHRLQVLLTNEIMKYIDVSDKVICATCYPLNFPSLSNLMKLGLSINKLKSKYDSRLRYILSNKKYEITSDEILFCDSNDTSRIKNILEDGYIGVKLETNKKLGKSTILFQKGTYLNEIG